MSRQVLKDLTRRLSKATSLEKQSELLNLIGQEYRELNDFDEAIEHFGTGAGIAESLLDYENWAFDRRALAEIYSKEGDEVKTFVNLDSYGEAARRWGNHGQIQLHLHVSAWVREQLWAANGGDRELLTEALRFAHTSLQYLDTHRSSINNNKDEVKRGGNSDKRKAALHRLMSCISLSLDEKEHADKYINKALHYARNKGDNSFICDCLMTKTDFPWICKVKTAQELLAYAKKTKKAGKIAEAKLKLALAKLEAGELCDASVILHELLKEEKHLNAEDKVEVKNSLIFAFKVNERLKMKENPSCSHSKKRICTEKVADAFAEKNMNRLAFQFYTELLDLSETTEEKAAAVLSLAETARELKEYKVAEEYFVKLLALENEMGVEAFDTENCLLAARCNHGEIGRDELLMEVDRLEKRREKGNMSVVYESAINYFGQKKDVVMKERYERMLVGWNEENVDNDTDDQIPKILDKFDKMTDVVILEKIKMDMSKVDREAQMKAEKDKKVNQQGETQLHIAARTDDQETLKKLLDLGYSVNKVCNGGWTPLSEAVSAGLIDNARMLLEKGADVNCVSKECCVGEDSEAMGGGGLTPLMEAAMEANCDMAWLLLRFKASVTMTNSDGWTAADFLYEAMKKEDREGTAACKQLLKKIQEMQRIQGFTPRNGSPPPRRANTRSMPFLKKRMARSPGKVNLDIYRRTMGSLGARTKVDKRGGEIAELDEEEGGEDEEEGMDEDDVPLSDFISSTGSASYSTPANKRRSGRSNSSAEAEIGRGLLARQKKRRTQEEDYSAVRVVHDSEEEEMVVEKRNRRSMEREEEGRERKRPSLARRSFSPLHDISNGRIPPPSPASTSSVVSAATTTLMIKVEFGYLGCEASWRDPKLLGLPFDSTVSSLSTFFSSELTGRDHSWWSGGHELDGTISLSSPSLISSSSRSDSLTVICRLHIHTMMAEFGRHCDEEDKKGPLMNILERFDKDGILEVKNISVGRRSGEAFLKALTIGRSGNHSRVERVFIDGWDMDEDAVRAVSTVVKGSTELTLRECRLDDELLALLVKELGEGSSSLRVLDFSFNCDLTSSSSLCSLLSLTPHITEFVLCGLPSLDGSSSLLQQLASSRRLQKISITHSPWFGDKELSLLTPPTHRLTQLNLTSTAIKDFVFESSWGSSLRVLVLSACLLSPSSWSSLSSWLRTPSESPSAAGPRSLSRLEIASTTARIDLVEAAASCTQRFVIDISGCDRISMDQLVTLLSTLSSTGRRNFQLRLSSSLRDSLTSRCSLASGYLLQ